MRCAVGSRRANPLRFLLPALSWWQRQRRRDEEAASAATASILAAADAAPTATPAVDPTVRGDTYDYAASNSDDGHEGEIRLNSSVRRLWLGGGWG